MRAILDYEEGLDYKTGWPDLIPEVISIDTETTGLNPREDDCVSISMSRMPDEAFVMPAVGTKDHRPFTSETTVVMHNAAFDVPVLRRAGWDTVNDPLLRETPIIELPPPKIDDTMIMAYILGKPRVGLKELGRTELGIDMQGIDSLIFSKGKKKSDLTMADVPWDLNVRYSGADADVTLQLHQVLWPQLASDPELKALYELEMAVQPMLIRMADVGCLVDGQALKEMSGQIDIEIARIERDVQYAVDIHDLNLESPAQISKLLFDTLGLDPVRSTNTLGQYSTSRDILEDLVFEHPIVEHILEHRRLKKLKGTFIDKLPGIASPITGRVHCSWNQARVITGRLSSSDPNLQQIPVRGKIGDGIREKFIAPPGWVMVGVDFKGIEVRVTAHLSKDPRLCEMIVDGVDPHGWYADLMFDLGLSKELENVPKQLRDVGKTSFFCTLYRGQAWTLSNLLRPVVKPHEARELCERKGIKPRWDVYLTLAEIAIDAFYSGYTGVADWQDREIALATERGYTQSLLSRRRTVDKLQSRSVKARKADERICCNHPVQATAGGDVMKAAMSDVWDALGAYEWYEPCLQVHDELQQYVIKEKGEEVKFILEEVMPNCIKLDVPLAVDAKIGHNWAETH